MRIHRTKIIETIDEMCGFESLTQWIRRKVEIKKKTVLALFLSVCMLSMSGCMRNDDSSSTNNSMSDNAIDTTTDDKAGEVAIPAGVNYDEMFTGKFGERQKTDGKYAMVTEDGLIRWDEEYKKYEQTPQIVEMMKKITIDGVPVTLPMKFEDITKVDPNLKDLMTLDCKEILHFGGMPKLKNEKTGYSFSGGTEVYENEEDRSFDIEIKKQDNFFLNIEIDVVREYIRGFSSFFDTMYHLSSVQMDECSDVRVDGIGRGNTFNEMYEKFGTPESICNFSDGTTVEYSYDDEVEKKKYFISFINFQSMKNPKSEEKEEVQKNMIQFVTVYVREK